MARRRSVSRFVRPAPKTKMWIGTGNTVGTIVGVTPLHYALLNAAALLLRPFTILRTRMIVSLQSDQAAVSESPQGGFGAIVTTEQATDVGITALPDPVADPDSDWFIYQGWSTTFEFLSSVGFHPSAETQYLVDSKAMRKVGINDQMSFIVANRVAVGALIKTEGRMLIQLH